MSCFLWEMFPPIPRPSMANGFEGTFGAARYCGVNPRSEYIAHVACPDMLLKELLLPPFFLSVLWRSCSFSSFSLLQVYHWRERGIYIANMRITSILTAALFLGAAAAIKSPHDRARRMQERRPKINLESRGTPENHEPRLPKHLNEKTSSKLNRLPARPAITL